MSGRREEGLFHQGAFTLRQLNTVPKMKYKLTVTTPLQLYLVYFHKYSSLATLPLNHLPHSYLLPRSMSPCHRPPSFFSNLRYSSLRSANISLPFSLVFTPRLIRERFVHSVRNCATSLASIQMRGIILCNAARRLCPVIAQQPLLFLIFRMVPS